MALAIAGQSCFALNDMRTDLQAMYAAPLPDSAIAQLTETFQGFNSLTYETMDKYPSYIIFRRGPGIKIHTILCGSNQDGEITLVKKSEDLENIVPIRRFIQDCWP